MLRRGPIFLIEGVCRFFCVRGFLIRSLLESGIETRSLPTLARSYPRRFSFYLGNPFPGFRGQINQSD